MECFCAGHMRFGRMRCYGSGYASGGSDCQKGNRDPWFGDWAHLWILMAGDEFTKSSPALYEIHIYLSDRADLVLQERILDWGYSDICLVINPKDSFLLMQRCFKSWLLNIRRFLAMPAALSHCKSINIMGQLMSLLQKGGHFS